MRFIILVSFLILTMQLQTVFAKNEIQLTGNISSLEITQEQKRVKVSYIVKLTLTNRNELPILLLNSDSSLLCISRDIYGISSNDLKERKLFSFATLPSSEKGAKKWEVIKTNLSSEKPPPNLIQKLRLNESISFEEKEWFYISKEKDVYNENQNVLWDEIKDAKFLSLKLEFRVWSLNLERHSGEKEVRPFGKELRERWRKYGYLLLDDIISEPIALDLSSAVVKTESQP
jgi:hypothetical protein